MMKKVKLFKKLFLTSVLPIGAVTTIMASSCSNNPNDKFNDNLKQVGKALHHFYGNWSPSSGSKSFENLVKSPQYYPLFADFVAQLIYGRHAGTVQQFNIDLQKYFMNNQYAFTTTDWNKDNYAKLVSLVSHSIIYLIGAVLVAYTSYKYQFQETIEDTKSGSSSATSYWGSYMKFFSDSNIMPPSFINLLNATVHYDFVSKSGVFVTSYFTHDWKVNIADNLNNSSLFNLVPLANDQNIPTTAHPNQALNGLFFKPSANFLFNLDFNAHYDLVNKVVTITNFTFKLKPDYFLPNTDKLPITTNVINATNQIFTAYKKWLPSQASDKDNLWLFFQQLPAADQNLYYLSFKNIENKADILSSLKGLTAQLGSWSSAQKTSAITAATTMLENLAILKFSCLMIYQHRSELAAFTKKTAVQILTELETSLITSKFIGSDKGTNSFNSIIKFMFQQTLASPKNLYFSNKNLYDFLANPIALNNFQLFFKSATTYPTTQAPTNTELLFGSKQAQFSINFNFSLAGSNLIVNDLGAFLFT